MQKRNLLTILGVMLAVVVASLTLVFAVGPRVSADSEVVLNQESHFKINDSHQLTGISGAGKSLINGKKFRVVIPSSVTSIGEAFRGSSGLTTVTFAGNSQLTSIGDYAFNYCSGLTSIEIPSSVTSIGGKAFYGCSGLTTITVDEANPNYYSNGGNCIVERSTNTLIAGCKKTVIPSSVTSIGGWAFYYCSGLTSIEIPSGVTSIGDNAFRGCSGLTSIEIPSSVTSIDSYAFYGCSGLTTVTFAENSRLTSISGWAFYYCSGLTSIEIPSSVTSISGCAFAYCNGLTTITVDEANPNYYSNGDNCIVERSTNTLIVGCKKTVIPSSVTSIGDEAFYGCWGLTSIEIPSRVTSIGNSAFWGCSGLTSIEIPSSVTSIGNDAFYYCSGLTSIEIPSGVTSIGDNAFRECSGLTEIVVRDPALMNNSELTQYASKLHYGADQNTVEFVTNCATTVDNRTVDFGATTTEPTLQKEHYHLVGWYRDEAFTQLFTFDTPIKYNTTLYAKWEEDEETPNTLGENDTNKFNPVIAWVGGGIAVTLSLIAVVGIVVAKKRRI